MLKKIEKFIFYFFIFTLPFQTRVILKSWGASFNEWNSAFLYGTDVLVLILFVFWTYRLIHMQGLALHVDKLLLGGFVAMAALSISQADNQTLGFYRLIKILEFAALFYYVRSSLGKVFTLTGSLAVIVASGFFQGLIAIGQSLLQRSLELKWLGESVLRTNFSGVAVVATEGEKFLRAYGTTPHPNVLAAWLFLAIFAFYFLFLYHTQKSIDTTIQRRSGYSFCFKILKQKLCTPRASRDAFLLVIYPILLWGFFSTFSRVAIGLWAAGILIIFLFFLIRREKYRLSPVVKKSFIFLFLTTVIIASVFSFVYWPQVQSRIFISGQEQAVSQRILYAKMAGEIASQKPWLGVGLGQFVPALQTSFKNYPDYFYQPVHNIYLLIVDEVGFLGLAVFLGWLVFLMRKYVQRTGFKKLYHASFFIGFLSVLAMGLFDHFPWTLQQGQLIFWLMAGLISASDKALEVV